MPHWIAGVEDLAVMGVVVPDRHQRSSKGIEKLISKNVEPMRSTSWLRLGGVSVIAAGFFGGLFELLAFLSHGPTGFDRRIPVLGMYFADYQRLQLIPGLIFLIALIFVYFNLKPVQGCRVTGFLVILVVGQLMTFLGTMYDYLLFPYPDPKWGGGFILALLALPVLFIGWFMLGSATVRMQIKPRWGAYLPNIMAFSIGIIISGVLFELLKISISLPITPSLIVAWVGGVGWILFGYFLLKRPTLLGR